MFALCEGILNLGSDKDTDSALKETNDNINSKNKTNDTTECDFCLLHIPTKIFQVHHPRCKAKHAKKLEEELGEMVIECIICTQFIPISQLNEHEPQCLSAANANDNIKCPYCSELVNVVDIDSHEYECRTGGAIKKLKDEAYSILNKTQLKALEYSNNNQKAKQLESIELLKERCNLDDIKYHKLLDRFNTSYIVINFHPELHLALFDKDTNYRNLFETNTSSGSMDKVARRGWESGMFGKIYDNSEPSERCKYGVLNIEKGCYVNSASRYGNSYFIMKPSVKYRSTFTYGDSSVYLETYSYQYPESFLSALPTDFVMSLTNSENVSPSHGRGYIETQIHGDVRFDRDIFALVADDCYRDKPMEELLVKFCDKNNILLQWKSNVLS